MFIFITLSGLYILDRIKCDECTCNINKNSFKYKMVKDLGILIEVKLKKLNLVNEFVNP
jgi:hypothetical protein